MPQRPLDLKRIHSGEIPWSLKELGAAFAHAAVLHETPHDDWDRRPVGGGDSVSQIVFNPDLMDDQLMQWLMDKFKVQGLTHEEKMSHAWRFMEAQVFLKGNVARLRLETLLGDDPSDSDCTNISNGLIEALATARYEGVRLTGPEGEPAQTFHLDRIISEANRLDPADGSGG